MKGLLKGVKILDFSRLLPGPMCTHLLSDMGAEILRVLDESKIEEHVKILEKINKNKKSIYLDLKQLSGRQKIEELILNYDVIVESFRPGVMKRLGLDYESLIKINPHIIYCSITGYGQNHPMSDHPGHDINYIGYTGILDQTGRRGSAPALSNFQIADIAGGSMMAAIKILAALYQREKSRRGLYIDVSMIKGVMGLSSIALATNEIAQKNNKTISRGEDLLNGGSPCYNVYETSDQRFMALGALEIKFWKKFLELIDRTDLLQFHMSSGESSKKLHSELTSIFKTKTQKEWTNLLSNHETCCTPILNLTEALFKFTQN